MRFSTFTYGSKANRPLSFVDERHLRDRAETSCLEERVGLVATRQLGRAGQRESIVRARIDRRGSHVHESFGDLLALGGRQCDAEPKDELEVGPHMRGPLALELHVPERRRRPGGRPRGRDSAERERYSHPDAEVLGRLEVSTQDERLDVRGRGIRTRVGDRLSTRGRQVLDGERHLAPRQDRIEVQAPRRSASLRLLGREPRASRSCPRAAVLPLARRAVAFLRPFRRALPRRRPP